MPDTGFRHPCLQQGAEEFYGNGVIGSFKIMSIYAWITDHLPFGKKIKRMSQQIPEILLKTDRLMSRQLFNYYWEKTLSCKEMGVSGDRLCNEEVVVSLTSFGDRVKYVHLAIESIMQQTMKPNRIVLWLAEDEFKEKTLPIALQLQQKRGLEIVYCEDLKSYKKLIPSLKRFPDACIITIDDDIAYCPDMVEQLIQAHKDNQTSICALRMHGIVLDDKDNIKPYREWQWCINKCPENNKLAFFTTGGGVLFPPHCFPVDVFDKSVFMGMCGTTDDVWFNAMRILNGVNVRKVFSVYSNGYLSELPSSNINPLHSNNWSGGNDRAINAVYRRYNLFDKLR